jgi:alpha-galactosidase
VASGAVPIDLDVTGRGALRLVVGDGGNGVDYDHADWADARLLC